MILATVATIAAAVSPYVGTLEYPFLHDDEWAVVNNPVVVEGMDLSRVFTTNAWGNQPGYLHTPNYRPLSVLTLAVTHVLAGLDPVPYRVTNLLLHALLAVLLLAALVRLGVPALPAWLAASWFALHPVHVETVLFVVNREEMLCAAFWLGALILASRRSGLIPASHRRTWTLGSLAALAVLTALAVLSKEGGATIPALVLAVGLLWPGATGRLRSCLPPFLVSGAVVAAYLVLRVSVLGYLGAGAIPWQDNPLVLVSPSERLVGAMAVVFEAFRLLVAPVDGSVDYGYDALHIPGEGTGIRALGGLSVGILLLLAAIASARRGRPIAALGVLAMAVSWAPTSHLAFPSSIVLADRLLLLPSAGLTLVLAGLLTRSGLEPRSAGPLRRLAPVLVTLWTFVFVPLVVDRVGDYRDATTLFASSLRNRPGSTRLHNNLGLALLHGGRWVEAEAHLRRALAIDPTNAEAHNNLGLLLAGIGRPGSAAQEFRRALEIRPNLGAAAHNLCLLMLRLGHEAGPICDHARALGAPVDERRFQ